MDDYDYDTDLDDTDYDMYDYAEAELAYYDDDPSPYDGTYSEE